MVPVGGEMAFAFNATDEMALAEKETFGAADAALYAAAILGTEAGGRKDFHRCGLRTDGAMRAVALGDWAMNDDAGHHQKTVVEEWKRPIAVIQGESDPFINADWMKDIAWGNLWKGKYHMVEGAGHAPFLERPEAYNKLLEHYLNDLFAR